MSEKLSFIRPAPDEMPLPITAQANAQNRNEQRQMDEDGKEAVATEEAAKRELDDKLAASAHRRSLMDALSDKSFSYLKCYSIFCGAVVLLQGFHPCIKFGTENKPFWNIVFRVDGFKIDDAPLTVLVGSTAVSVIGLVAIMLQGLFKIPKEDAVKDTSKSTDKKASS